MSRKTQNRQAQRTQSALKAAFIELLQESNYESITVGDITEQANVGRSTFYRHYNSKPDILLHWHADIFADLNLGQYTAVQWANNTPPPALANFFTRVQNSRMAFHEFGHDGAYVLREIGNLFTQQIENSLEQTFSAQHTTTPLPILARSIAGVYASIFQWWIMETPSYTPEQMATYTHQIMQGILFAGIDFSSEN